MLLNQNFTRSKSHRAKIIKKVRFLDENKKDEKQSLRKSTTLFPESQLSNIRQGKKFIIKKGNFSKSPNPSKNSPGTFTSVSKISKSPTKDSLSTITPLLKKRSTFFPTKITKNVLDKYSRKSSKDTLNGDHKSESNNNYLKTPTISNHSNPFREQFSSSQIGELTDRQKNREIYERLIIKEKENRKKSANAFLRKNNLKLKNIKGILKNNNDPAVQFYSQANSVYDESEEKDTPPEVKNEKSIFFKTRENPYRRRILSFVHPNQKDEKLKKMGKLEFEKAERHSMEFELICLKDILTKAVKLNEKDIEDGDSDRLCTIFSSSRIRNNDENKALLYVIFLIFFNFFFRKLYPKYLNA